MDQVCDVLRVVILTYIGFIIGVNGQIGNLIIEEGNKHSAGSTISSIGTVPVSPADTRIVRWLFNETTVCTVTIASNAIVGNSDKCDATSFPSGSSSFYYASNSVIRADLSGGSLNLNLTYNKAKYEDYILQMKLYDAFADADVSNVILVTVTNCTGGNEDTGNLNLQYNDIRVVQCQVDTSESVTATCLSNASLSIVGSCSPETTTAAATTTMSNGIVTTENGSPQGNNTGTTSGSDSSSDRSTISSITEATGGPVTTSRELDPGAIVGIVIGALVGVLLILFLIWWFSEAFRSCLHDISDCFPEDHCCGKGTC